MIEGYWGQVIEGSPRQMRRAALESDFVPYVKRIFADHPSMRSALLAVAQYWADEADDAVHARVIFSERPTPAWPHHCDWETGEDEGGDAPEEASPDGERCSSCGDYDWMPFDDNGGAIAAFQACCREDASQESATAEAYLPYAVARRGDDDAIEVELVGGPVRAWLDEVPAGALPAPAARTRDAQELSLFEVVRAAPRDDGPRHVLADALQQRGDPLGEYIALALADRGGDAAQTVALRLRELEASHGADWLGPLADCAPSERVVFARGFVKSLAVHLADDAAAARVESAREWGTVEELAFLPESTQRLSPAMTSLREVGPLNVEGIEELFRVGRSLPLERVHIVLGHDRMLARLAELDFPALTCLVVGGTAGGPGSPSRTGRNPFTGEELTLASTSAAGAELGPALLAPLRRSPCWPRLTELVIVSHVPEVVSAWLDPRLEPRPPTITFATPARGYEIGGFRVRVTGGRAEVDMPMFGAEHGLAQVGPMLAALPPVVSRVELVSTRWWTPTVEEARLLSRASGKRVEIRATG